MSDLGRAKSAPRADADGTKVEDDRQLTELLMQNRVSLRPAAVAQGDENSAAPLGVRVKTGFLLFFALPLSLLAYFSTRTEEDDFYA